MPKKDKNGIDLQLGQYVTIGGCTQDPTTGQCSSLAPEDVAFVSNATIPTATAVRQKDGNGGLASRADNCSYGELSFNVSALTVVTVKPNCSALPLTSCDPFGLHGQARNYARAQLGDALFNTFTNFHLILDTPLCSWAGLATLGGNLVWLKPQYMQWQIPMQEIVHNFWLFHSWKDGYEYYDLSTFMGMGTACPNTPEMAWLGWATPAAGGGSLSSQTIPVGKITPAFTLPATYVTGRGSYVRVRTDWLSWYSGVEGRNLYFEFRMKALGDNQLASENVNRVIIHEVNATMDNNMGVYRNWDRKINWMQALAPNSRLVLSSKVLGVNYSLVAYAGNFTGTARNFLPIYLCRYPVSEAECPSIGQSNKNNNAGGKNKQPPPPSTAARSTVAKEQQQQQQQSPPSLTTATVAGDGGAPSSVDACACPDDVKAPPAAHWQTPKLPPAHPAAAAKLLAAVA
ncbi:hypothetical protein HYH02_007998 [Chlamydomonas schloesseri]|uniref:Peptidase M11 gametolysin domain-containing protein n=1 Tax=Chlamydomonas schloesseri TaxID=2026947 RepID=A0A835WH59_9CHLO|nr:hypothetical protein HYH02_007998 [Chlamydomonas schloesseri]|eukprot:KAG2447258.1 hypothetical protein HYH02_007998 [Chlamydomonas schloesseri]